MIYGYLRVSTTNQTLANQKFEIIKNYPSVDKWWTETKSGTINYKDRVLGRLIGALRPGDTIICSEISRLGRSLYMIMEIMNVIIAKGATLITVKENFVLNDSINSKVVSFAFGLSAEIERNLISQRTKEALALRKAQGQVLGRPKGSHNKHHKLESHRKYIIQCKQQGRSNNYIRKHLHCHVDTLKTFLEQEGL